MKTKTISSHSLNILLLFICVIATFSLYFVLRPKIEYLFNHKIEGQNIAVLLFFLIFSYHVLRYYLIAFNNSVIRFNSAKIKISFLFSRSKVLNLDEIESVSIKYRLGGEYAIIKYKFNSKYYRAYTYQHPFDHALLKLVGRNGLFESGNDWIYIYELKNIVESRALHPS